MVPRKPSPIVVVDDDDDDFILFARLLNKIGVKNPVTRFSNGADAIRYLRRIGRSRRLPCLMFLDVKMPGLTGFDVLAWIRSQAELADLKVVMLSSDDDPTDTQAAVQIGADYYLTKFPPPAEIAHVIFNVCRLAPSPV